MGEAEKEVTKPLEAGFVPFNNPLESALRSLVLLVEAHPNSCDLQRLIYFDYLLVHSADAGGPESLHPATPNRSGELLVRRTLLNTGLLLLISRGLAERRFSETGIIFSASETSWPFLDLMKSNYANLLRERATWVLTSFGRYTDESLREFFRSRLDQWGAEFEAESLFREMPT